MTMPSTDDLRDKLPQKPGSRKTRRKPEIQFEISLQPSSKSEQKVAPKQQEVL
jgi:hypothetical protein